MKDIYVGPREASKSLSPLARPPVVSSTESASGPIERPMLHSGCPLSQAIGVSACRSIHLFGVRRCECPSPLHLYTSTRVCVYIAQRALSTISIRGGNDGSYCGCCCMLRRWTRSYIRSRYNTFNFRPIRKHHEIATDAAGAERFTTRRIGGSADAQFDAHGCMQGYSQHA